MSLFLGAEKIPFGTYGRWRALERCRELFSLPIFGANIKNPKSPAFWLSAVLLVMISVFSILIQAYFTEEKITGLSLPAFTERKNVV